MSGDEARGGDPLPLRIILELARAEEAADPFAFRFAPQTYLLREEGGSFESATFPWGQEVIGDLDALQRPRPDRTAMQRLGDRLRAFLEGVGWGAQEAQILAALAAGRCVHITLRAAAAELYALPWELVTLRASGQHLGELPGVLIVYEWPDTRTAPRCPEPPHEGGRILFAWSAAGGAVPAEAHVRALRGACAAARLPFDEARDVIPRVSLARLQEALAAPGEPPAVLHILCHGGAIEAATAAYGLLWSAEGAEGSVERIDAGALRQALAPHAGSLRLVVLCACHLGSAGALENHLGSVAQALHRVGIPAVVASRYPLSVEGSVTLAEALFRQTLEGLRSLEDAFLAARARLGGQPAALDWASMQLYAREADGPDHRPFVFRPYRGLLAFGAAHKAFYFGREQDIARLLAALRSGERLLTVVGASGSGKSSMLMAGLVPAIEAGALGGARPVVRVLRPGERPLSALAAALASLERPDLEAGPLSGPAAPAPFLEPIEAALGGGREALAAKAARAIGAGPPGLLLIVDQLEELFTLAKDPHDVAAFLDNVLHAPEASGAQIRVILGVRADFLGHCLDRPALAERVRSSMFVAHPLTETQLRDVIVRPAALVGLSFDDGLVEALIDALREELPGGPQAASEAPIPARSLPLLQFALEQLWEHREGSRISWQAWRSIRGVRGALARRADEVLEGANPAERDLSRHIFSRLVQIGEGAADTRRYAPRAEIEAVAPGKVGPVLDRWIRARLLTADEAQVAVAHEALIREWSMLRRWIGETRDALRLRQELAQAAARWQGEGKNTDDLWRGARLERAVELLESRAVPLAEAEAAFLDASRKERQHALDAAEAQRRREVRMLRAGAALMAVLLVVVGVALIKERELRDAEEKAKNDAEKARREIEKQQEEKNYAAAKRREAALIRAARELLSRDPTTAILLLLEVAPPGETLPPGWLESAARAIWQPISRAILRHPAPVEMAAWAGAGAGWEEAPMLTVAGGAAWIWPPDGASAPRALKHGRVTAAAWSPDGRRVLTAAGLEARIWLADGAGEEMVLRGHAGDVTQVAWSPGGDRALTIGKDKTARIWIDETEVQRLDAGSPIRAAAWSPDGARIALALERGLVRVWTIGSGGPPVALQADEQTVEAVAWSPGGRDLATASRDGNARIWRADGKGQPRVLRGHRGPVRGLAWSPDGSRLLTVSSDKTARIWPVAGGAPVVLRGHKGVLFAGSFSPDGQRVVTVSDGQAPRVWSIDGDAGTVLQGHAGPVASAVWSPDGRWLLTASADRTARVWPRDGTGDPGLIQRHASPVLVAAWSPDGSRILTAEENGAARIWQPGVAGEPVALGEARSRVTAAAWSPDSKHVATASPDHAIQIWPAGGAAAPVARLQGPAGAVRWLSWNPRRSSLLVVAEGGAPRILPTSGQDGGPAVSLDGHAGNIVTAAWSPDGERVLIAAEGIPARIWPADGRGEPVILKHTASVLWAAWSHRGDRVVTVGADKIARIGPASGGDHQRELREEEMPLESAAWSPDDRQLLVVTSENTTLVWTDESDKPARLTGAGASFSSDGRVLTLPRSLDTLVQLWSARGAPADILESPVAVREAAWSPDGKRLLTISDDNAARVWPLNPVDLRNTLDRATDACLGVEELRALLPDVEVKTADACPRAPLTKDGP